MSVLRRRHRRTVTAVAIALSVGACGLPIDDRVQPYDDVPFDLGGPTTTTIPQETTTTVTPDPEVTTTTIVRTVPVDIVYVLGGRAAARHPLTPGSGVEPAPHRTP